MQKLLPSNYNALIFFKKPSLYMFSWIVSLKTEDMHTFAHFKWFFNVHSIYFVKILISYIYEILHGLFN